MVQLVVGKKGKGKTKIILNMVNDEILQAKGNIVYLDKSLDHMYELNNKVRLINVSDFGMTCAEEFVGFILGLVSQDHDMEKIYLDSFLKIACLKDSEELEKTVMKLDEISSKYGFTIVASVSQDKGDLPEPLQTKVVAAL